MTSMLIFGTGYSAAAAAARNKDMYNRIVGTTRSASRFAELAAAGIEPMLYEDCSGISAAIEASDHLLVSPAPTEAGDPVLKKYGKAISQSGAPQWICYLSTVGVYGDHGGAWVDENSPCRPGASRSQWRLAAEAAWQRIADSMGVPLAIFRLAGIYGPGRNAFMSIERGTSRRIIKAGQVFNRIHRDDIAKAYGLAAREQVAGIFNVSDDLPAPPQDVVAFAHELAGSEPPPAVDFAEAEMTPMARSFYSECKRVCNRKSKSVLGLDYDWPEYRSSLARMWREGSWRSS